MHLYRRLLRFVKPYRPRLALAMALMLIVGVMNGGYAYLMKLVMGDILINKRADMLVPVALAIISMVTLKGVFDYFQTYFMASVGQRVVTDLRRLVFDRVQRQPLSFFDKNPTGVIISRITSDITLVQGAGSDAFSAILKELVTFVALVGYAFYVDWRLATVSFVVIPSVVYPISTFGRRLRKNSVQNQKAMARFTTFLHETFTGQRIVKAFAMEHYELERFSHENESLFRVVMRRYRIKALSSPIVEVIGVVAIGLIIWYGGSRVISGALKPEGFMSFLTALALLYNPIRSLNKENHNVQQGLGAAQRVFEYVDAVPEISEKPNAQELSGVQGVIEFDKVTFKYDDKAVLKDLSLRINRNETVAIVGESGGGKTTMVNLIPRFYDVVQGAVLIDGIDVRDVTLRSLRKNVALVTQDVILFNDTVVSNIIHGTPLNEANVDAAIESAYASDFVAKLPKKLETIVGEKGTRLSGGQKQRIAIARALYKDAPILILDEATSALDTASEVEVQKALDNLMKGRTTIVIAHRLSTVVNADRIVVLQNGSIVQQGNHQELLGQDGPYRKLYELQFRDEPEKKVIRMPRRRKNE